MLLPSFPIIFLCQSLALAGGGHLPSIWAFPVLGPCFRNGAYHILTCLFPLPDSELWEGTARHKSRGSEILVEIFKNKMSFAYILLGP